VRRSHRLAQLVISVHQRGMNMVHGCRQCRPQNVSQGREYGGLSANKSQVLAAGDANNLVIFSFLFILLLLL